MFESVQHLDNALVDSIISTLLKVISCFAIAHLRSPGNSFTYKSFADSVLDQPCQGFLAGLKSGKFAAGEATQVCREYERNALRSRPCGFLNIGLVEDGGFFHNPNRFLAKGCSLEIGKY